MKSSYGVNCGDYDLSSVSRRSPVDGPPLGEKCVPGSTRYSVVSNNGESIIMTSTDEVLDYQFNVIVNTFYHTVIS